MPFGSKSREEIFECAGEALRVLRRETDIVVFGCNTASVTVRPKDVFCLHPDLDSCDPQRTLMLATPATVAATDARGKGFLTADTSELAVLVEVRLSLRFKSRTRLDCSDLEDYLQRRLAPFAGRADRVLIGCSHYVYAKVSPAPYTAARAPSLFSCAKTRPTPRTFPSSSRAGTRARNTAGYSRGSPPSMSPKFSQKGFDVLKFVV